MSRLISGRGGCFRRRPRCGFRRWGAAFRTRCCCWNGIKHRLILKQPLNRLRVQDEWSIDVSRNANEVEGLRLAHRVLPTGTVPPVVDHDDANCVLLIEPAVVGAKSYREQLLAGVAELSVASEAGQLLAQMHNAFAADRFARERFGDATIFNQARTDPYFRTAAERLPQYRRAIEDQIARLAEQQRTLIHGDFSPKNLIVQPAGPLVLIDFEVVHYGDPCFDVAFCLAMYVLMAVRFQEQTGNHLAAAGAFWEAYRERARVMTSAVLESETLPLLGCMLLARIDGKSKFEYITEESMKETVRNLAGRILGYEFSTMQAAIAAVSAMAADRPETV